MTRTILAASLSVILLSAPVHAADNPPLETLPRTVCESLSDTYWTATLALIKLSFCRTRQCIKQRGILERIRQDAQDAYIAGNCSYWTDSPALVSEEFYGS